MKKNAVVDRRCDTAQELILGWKEVFRVSCDLVHTQWLGLAAINGDLSNIQLGDRVMQRALISVAVAAVAAAALTCGLTCSAQAKDGIEYLKCAVAALDRASASAGTNKCPHYQEAILCHNKATPLLISPASVKYARLSINRARTAARLNGCKV
jgi:hypothetical protein